MKNKEYISIKKMIEYINKIDKYTQHYTMEQFANDEKTLEATVFCLSQIGELVKNISEETMNTYPNKWRAIKGLRNRIVHDYDGILIISIWKIVREEILQFRIDLEEILKNETGEN